MAGPRGRAMGGVLLGLPVQVGFAPPFLFPLGEGGKEEEERRKGGTPPNPSPIRFGLGGVRLHLAAASSLSTRAHEGPLTPGGFR